MVRGRCIAQLQSRTSLRTSSSCAEVHRRRALHSHYKPGVTETMMYKLFFADAVLTQLDETSISVVPFDQDSHGSQAAI